jgi:RNA polymerase I-specific transcription initiation factor RRN7
MRDRLPAAYIKLLKLPFRSPVEGDELHRVVMDLVLSYHFNYNLVFPEINHVPELIQFAKELALPSKSWTKNLSSDSLPNRKIVDSIIVTRKLASILGYQFQFPIEKLSNTRLDYPEIRLIALLIVATKLTFPFSEDTSISQPADLGSLEIPKFDWQRWRQGKQKLHTQQETKTGKYDFNKVTPSQVVSMDDEELDAYFAHVSSLIDITSKCHLWQLARSSSNSYTDNIGDNPITKFFPVEDLPADINQVGEISTSELDNAVQNLLSQTVKYNSSGLIETAKSSTMSIPRYEAFRKVDHLNQTAFDLYGTAGMFDTVIAPTSICDIEAKVYIYNKGAVVGASLETMTDAIYRVERAMVVWQTKNRHEGEH